MLLLRNKKNEKVITSNEERNGMLKSMMDSCTKWLQSLATRMQNKTEHLSVRGKIIMLLLFCALTSGLSIYLLSVSFSGKPLFSFALTAVKKPAHIGQSGDENTKTPSSISKERYQRIYWFKGYMDSLARSASGKKLHDSLMAGYPRLMDSVVLFENLYKTELKSKK